MTDDEERSKARNLHKKMTDAEQKLWSRLRGRRLKEIKFRREEPLGDYIVDLVSFDVDLVIEVDGSQHLDEQDYDERRTE